jgi:Spy/CpxP family protein refolding chaperone
MKQSNLKWTRWAAVAVLAAIGLAGTALAQGPGGPGGGDMGRMLSGMLGTALGLTDAQKTQIQSIVDQSKQSLDALSAQLQAAREAEKAAIKAGKSDAELAQLAQSYSALHTQVHTIRLQTESKIYKVLTSEQRTKLEQLMEEMKNRAQSGAGSGPQNRPGGR